MRTLPFSWLLLLLTVLTCPVLAQDDDLFGESPAKEEAAGDDLFGAPADEKPTEKADDANVPLDEKPVEEKPAADGDDLFGADEQPAADIPADKAAPEPAEEKAPAVPARKLHTRAEIKAELLRRNAQIADEVTKFIELNKDVAKQAVQSGNNEELMPILREYGPAVIRTKQLWLAVVGNPTKYDTWLGSADYWKAWVAFHNSWRTLYGYTDRFAAVDIGLADKLTNSLAALGTSFEDYSEWVDEWDSELGNDHYAFARGNDQLGELDREQMREEEGADDEAAKAFADQEREEEDATAPANVEEAEQTTETADKEELAEGEKEADAAADEAVAEEDMQEDAAVEGDDDLFGGEEAADKDTPAEEEAPAEEKPEAEGDDLFGEETPADEEKPAEEEQPAEEKPAEEKPADDEESADDLFGDG